MGSKSYLKDRPVKALVCFTGKTEIRWLKPLHKEYRHCFALLQTGNRWILYNPLSHRTDIQIFPDMPAPHLRRHLEESGHHVVECKRRPDSPLRLAPVFPYSCVEAVKRLLGLHKRSILTPYQLHRELKEHLMNKILDSPPPLCLYKQNPNDDRPSTPVLFALKREQKEN